MHNISQYLWFLIIYTFLGWCVEVIYHIVKSGTFVNRGFLNGPVCPIYGFGMITLIYCLTPLKYNLFLLFIGTVLLTSILEFLTGFILEKIFHDKWWDYSNMPFNINGYICLAFSIIWGLGGVFMIHIIHPPITKFVSFFDNIIGNIVLFVLLLYLLIDFIITVLGIMKIKRRIYILDDIAMKLRHYSDDIGENIYKGTTLAIQTKENLKYKLKEKNISIEELKTKYEKIVKEKGFVHRRLEKAFPNIKRKLSKLNHMNITNRKK